MRKTIGLSATRSVQFQPSQQTLPIVNLLLNPSPHDHPVTSFSGLPKRTGLCTLVVTLVLVVAFCSELASASAPGFSGLVKGGSTPISGASVQFYAVGNSGYGLTPTLLAQTNSEASGAFSFSVSICPQSNPQTYILATGGSAGNGSNSAIGLFALTGRCQSLTSSSFVTVNELTTVAANWALAQFADVTGTKIGTSSGNSSGLANAVAGAMTDLVRSVGTSPSNSGVPAKFLPAGSQCSAKLPPDNCDGLERMNSLANVLAACVLSAGPSSPACTALFQKTQTPQTGTTLEAAHQTVTHAKRNVGAIFGIQRKLSSLPYEPSLLSAPDGWELALLFTPAAAAFNVPVWVAVDGPGNIWVVNGGLAANSVSELPAGNYNNGATNFAPPGAGFSVPFALALDTAGNVFVANAAGNSVSELPVGNYSNGATHFSPATAAFADPAALALDVSANLWVANLMGGSGCSKVPPASPCGSISELKAHHYSTEGIHFASRAAKFDSLLTIALDSEGNVWTSNEFGNSVTELEAGSPRQAINFAPTSAAFDAPIALALDAANNVWVVNSQGGSGCGDAPPCGSVSELPADNRNSAVNFAPLGAAIVEPNSVAVDSDGNVWVSNFRGGRGCDEAPPCGSVSELPAGNPDKKAMNFAPAGAGFVHPTLLALDRSGNVWVTQFTGVSELIGLAAPVLTPIQACLKASKSICRP